MIAMWCCASARRSSIIRAACARNSRWQQPASQQTRACVTRNDVCFDLLQAIQACIDLAVHACTHESLGVPETPAAAFALLERHGVISTQLASRLAKATGLRNLIVHRYADILVPRLAEAITTGLGDLDEFATALQARAGGAR